ncbi:hypothetical protein CUN67_19240 [Pantoea cypripedii]|uniref:Uncharacterized protein n=1 Tax=Pantoea cypripedii TaxID=55209 RepID=A0A6B9GDS2_PANCY|nr:hypothetical protein CUN67_19240 [Pantoea cypripedii]
MHSLALRRLPRRFAVPSLTHASDGPASIRSCSTPPFAASMRLILESFPRSASSDGAPAPLHDFCFPLIYPLLFCAINLHAVVAARFIAQFR